MQFDVIIGNPPYVRQEILGPDFKSYAQRTFHTYASPYRIYTVIITFYSYFCTLARLTYYFLDSN